MQSLQIMPDQSQLLGNQASKQCGVPSLLLALFPQKAAMLKTQQAVYSNLLGNKLQRVQLMCLDNDVVRTDAMRMLLCERFPNRFLAFAEGTSM
jgi:hypothetical protein